MNRMALTYFLCLDLFFVSFHWGRAMPVIRGFRRYGAIRMGMAMFLGGLGLLIIQPFLASLMWATVLSILCMPIHDWLLVRIPHQKSLIPIVLIVLGAGMLVGPVFWVLMRFQEEVFLAYQLVADVAPFQALELWNRLKDIPIIGGVMTEMRDAFPLEAHDLMGAMRKILPQLGLGIRALFVGLTDQVLQLFITLLALYFFLRDGSRLMGQFREGLLPLLGEDLGPYFEGVENTVKAVSVGIFGSAMIQGFIASIGYLIFGLKTPLLLGVLSAICSLVPLVGASIVWGPLVFLLILQSQMGAALGLTLWGLLVVHPVDNILRPWVIGTLLQVPILIIVLGVIGGILSWGLIGIFAGPCVLTLILQAWSSWVRNSVTT